MNNYRAGSVPRVDRRRFVVDVLPGLAAALGAPWVASAAAATEDDLAFANFGVSAEFLAQGLLRESARGEGPRPARRRTCCKRGRSRARRSTPGRCGTSSSVPADVPPLEQDFEFAVAGATFAAEQRRPRRPALASSARCSAPTRPRPRPSTEPSLPHPLREPRRERQPAGRRPGALAARAPASSRFRLRIDLEAASDAIEAYLG